MFTVYEHIAQLLTLAGVARKRGRHPMADDLGAIEDAAVVVESPSRRIAWLGPTSALPAEFRNAPRENRSGRVWMPAWVECHTHPIFAGHRYHDYALRAAGRTYQEIGAAGGGILSTLAHTRRADAATLTAGARRHLEAFAAWGVGAIEVKTGYGLTLESEILALECVAALSGQLDLRLVPTFLPAHATPPEFKGRTDDYVKEIIRHWIPEVAKRRLAVFFDVFVEQGYFSVAQARAMGEAAKAVGLGIKIHGEQFVDLGSSALAVELGAVSCDHLDHVSERNTDRLASSDTVAVLLPGASIYTGTPFPPARRLIDAGARVALSTDFNPGTCPTHNLPLMTTFACSQMKMTVAEAIAAVTFNAAAATGLENEWGTVAVGNRLRVCEVTADHYEAIPYAFGEVRAGLVR